MMHRLLPPFVLFLLLFTSLAIAQPAERDPNAKQSSYITANGDVEQVVLDQKGPVGLVMMRVLISRSRWIGIPTIVLGVVIILFGVVGLLTDVQDVSGAIIFVMILGSAVTCYGIWLTAGATNSAMMNVLQNSTISIVR